MSLVMMGEQETPRVRLITPAPRGPRLARYVMCGEGTLYTLGTVYAFIVGTMGNWLLYNWGLYGETGLTVVMLATVVVVFSSIGFGCIYGDLWSGPAEGNDQADD